MLPRLQYGDVFLTRNTAEVGNESPGYWNHCAIVSHRGHVIESQQRVNSVIESKITHFLDRYPEYICIRQQISKIALDAARFAVTLLGSSYKWDASRFMFLRDPSLGENCVSVVRRSYSHATNKWLWWVQPDDIYHYALRAGWVLIRSKKDHDNWRHPCEWLAGRIR